MPLRHPPGWPPCPPAAPASSARPESTAVAASAGRRLHSAELFGANQEVEIEHGSSVYRLRQTALGKLILTK